MDTSDLRALRILGPQMLPGWWHARAQEGLPGGSVDRDLGPVRPGKKVTRTLTSRDFTRKRK